MAGVSVQLALPVLLAALVLSGLHKPGHLVAVLPRRHLHHCGAQRASAGASGGQRGPRRRAEGLTEVGRVVVGGTVESEVSQVGDQAGHLPSVDTLALTQHVELEHTDTVHG